MPRPDEKGPGGFETDSPHGGYRCGGSPVPVPLEPVMSSNFRKQTSGVCRICGSHRELRHTVDRMERELCRRLDHIDSRLFMLSEAFLENPNEVKPYLEEKASFDIGPTPPKSPKLERSRTFHPQGSELAICNARSGWTIYPNSRKGSDVCEFHASQTFYSDTSDAPSAQPEVFSLRAEFQADTMALRSLKSVDWKTLDDFNWTAAIGRRLPFLVLSPSARFRFFWDVVSMVLIASDMAVIPVNLAFATGDNLFSTYMFWPSLLFWMLDIPMTFVTGIYKDGRVELSYELIAAHYFKTWFLLDVFMVSLTWYEILAGTEANQGILLGRMTKTLRVLRILRSVRLLRLVKLRRILEDFSDRVTSEYFHTAVGVIRLTLIIVWTNHFIACGWWAIGTMEVDAVSDPEGSTAWATHYQFDGTGVGTQYFTSLHWSLTQFTPASMEVMPRNSYERIFAVVVLLFAMIVFSSFISSITAAITQLRKISSTLDKNFSMLRRYLRVRNTPTDLTVRIVRCVEHRLNTRQQGVLDESEVEFLKFLSKPLQMELLSHNYSPTIIKHPFFRRYAEVDSVAMQHVCRDAVTKFSLSTGDALFTEASSGKQMYFVLTGQLRYYPNARAGRHRGRKKHAVEGIEPQAITGMGSLKKSNLYRPVSECLIEEGEWCCEGCLWTKWSHSGTMTATRMSEVLAIDATAFALITNSHRKVVNSTVRYGVSVVDRLNTWAWDGVVSDVTNLTATEVEELVESSFLPRKADVQAPQAQSMWRSKTLDSQEQQMPVV